jgi:alanyl-tRNA synthetase
MKSPEIRSKFFDFFTRNGHEQVASSSLIPAQDPTLLFANAGMNQFKDVFLGLEKRSYSRAVSIQKCVRAGGKHNDLDNVGFTKRHLTFFEMMGNFSFGDYFKKEAIQYAWDFLTKELKLSAENLHVSVYKTDDEAYDIWHKTIGIPAHKIHRLGEEENFWAMGDVGPCGPCTEIHIDRGVSSPFDTFAAANTQRQPAIALATAGGDREKRANTGVECPDPVNCGPACNCDRFLEIWNLVFMQFDRQANGDLKELKHKGVDTGMGLERLSVVMQNKDSVFQTDMFETIIKKTEELSGKQYAQQPAELQAAFHVLADHARSTTMLISDGCAPSNDGRGYVLRKIIRRAALFAQKLSDNQALFPELSRVVVAEMGAYYPTLKHNAHLVHDVLTSEIKKFASNLVRGKNILEQYIKEQAASKKITGEQAFKMYDTYGFPLELTILIAQEQGYSVDGAGFEAMMQKQQEQSGQKVADALDHLELEDAIQTEFTGYHELNTQSKISALIFENKQVAQVAAQETCWVIAPRSPYFIVGGGQVPDTGYITIGEHAAPVLSVRYINGRIAAQIKAPVNLALGQEIVSHVDPVWRTKAMKNHTGTHLLQAALMQVLGSTVKQSGSLVHPDYLRFDFTYHDQLSPEQIKQVEDLVNEKIYANIPVTIHHTTMREAVKHGALAFFGDKYNPEKVRMVDVDGFSVELCGGTHVRATGDIGAFKITESSALSAGHRRIVAVTGPGALELFQEACAITQALSQEFKVKREQIMASVQKLKEQNKEMRAEIQQLKKLVWVGQIPSWISQAQHIKTQNSATLPFLFLSLKDVGIEDLREIAAGLAAHTPGFYFLTSMLEDRGVYVGALSPDYATRVDLKKFATWLKDAQALPGGGSKNSIQGGGAKFDANLKGAVEKWLAEHGA